jgi:hypothetical protein
MNRRHWLTLAGALALGGVGVMGGRASAGFEQSYSAWHKSPYSYYYRYYYSQPKTYDYVILYPKQPRYLYYYNPTAKLYWGRFDLKAKGYSLLAEADRKGLLKDIPESKFPEPGDMPQVPGGKDGETVQVPPDDLPADLPTGEDLTAKTDTPKTDPAKADADPAPVKPAKPSDPATPADPQPGTGGAVTPANSGTTADPPKPPANPGPATPAPGSGAGTPAPGSGATAPPAGSRDSGPVPLNLPPGKDSCPRKP